MWPDSLLEDGTTNPAYVAGGAYGLNCPTVGGCMESQAFPLPPELEILLRSRDEPNADIRVHRVMDWLPERSTDNRVQTSQLTLGLEGELGNEWIWDTALSYGASETTTLNKGASSLAPIDRMTQDGPTAPVQDWVGTQGCDFGLDCSGYDYQAFTTFNYFTGPWSASLRWNHYPTIKPAAYATNSETRVRGVFEDYDVFSLSGSYRMSDRYVIRAGIDNLLDEEPPLSGGSYAADGDFVNMQNPPDLPSPATPTGSSRYDQLGRRFYVGVEIAF